MLLDDALGPDVVRQLRDDDAASTGRDLLDARAGPDLEGAPAVS
jgi:hypothetical protein